MNPSETQKKCQVTSPNLAFRTAFRAGSEGKREETDEDYDVVCNESDVTR